ncbi:AsmA family protein [Pelagibius sp. CAU 1746]|uniref:AsmA family protein n=1 Tax=Pelagibius sp. CAU 1746 TaxID=3140370 RepID=UPI00325BBBBD
MKKLLIGLGVIVLLLIVAVIVVPMLVPLESYKGEIQARVKEQTGRDLRIDGGISLSLLPSLAVSVENVGFANAPGASTPEMATIDRLDVALQILPLLSGEVAIDRFILDKPVITLEVDKNGRPNWQLDTAAAAPSGDGGGSSGTGGAADAGGSLKELRLGDVRLVDGTLTYIDHQGGQEFKVSDVNMELSLPSLTSPFAAEGSAVWNSQKVSLEIDAESPQALMSGETSKLAMKVDSAPVTFSFDGAARNAGALGLQGALALDVPSIRELAAWAGQPLDFPGDGLGPFNIAGELEMVGAKVALTNAKIRLDEINGDGLFSVDATGAKPFIKAELNVEELNVNPYLPPEQEGAAAGGSGGGASGGSGGGTAGGGDWSDDPIDVSALGLLNADLAFNAGGILFKDVKIGKSSLAVILKDSKLTADLAEMQLYDGAGKGKITVDGSSGKPSLAADFDLANFQAGPFLNDLAKFDRILGTTESKVSVKSSGGTQRELVSNLNGNGAVVFRDGAIKGINLAAMMRNISVAAIESSFDEAQATDFAELSGTFKIAKGIVTNDDLTMVAPLVRMTGAGTVPLPPRTVDYTVKPKLVGSLEGQGGQSDLAGVAVPIKVSGPWSDLSYKPDLAGALKEQIKDPGAVMEKLQNEEGAKGLLEGLVPGGSGDGDSGSSSPLDLKKGLFGN